MCEGCVNLTRNTRDRNCKASFRYEAGETSAFRNKLDINNIQNYIDLPHYIAGVIRL